MDVTCEQRGPATIAWIRGRKHRFYEDRYRILNSAVPIVARQGRGELYGVFDGIGSAPRGMQAAQTMCDRLLPFFQEPEAHTPNSGSLVTILMMANQEIHDWGFMPGTDRPEGGCAGTVAWIKGNSLTVFHAGDTEAALIRDGRSIELTRVHQTANGAIFRYFGLGAGLEIDVSSEELKEWDRVLIVTDGVTKIFHITEAADVVEQAGDSRDAAIDLVQQSLGRGSRDDITVMIVDVEEFLD